MQINHISPLQEFYVLVSIYNRGTINVQDSPLTNTIVWR
jgi:hypothetical protein